MEIFAQYYRVSLFEMLSAFTVALAPHARSLVRRLGTVLWYPMREIIVLTKDLFRQASQACWGAAGVLLLWESVIGVF